MKAINQIWHLLSNVGIDELEDTQIEKNEIKTINRIAIILLLLFMLIISALIISAKVLKVKPFTLNDIRLLISGLSCCIVLGLNYLHFRRVSKIVLSLLPLVILIIFPVIIGTISEDLIFITSIIVITYSTIPHFIFNFLKEKEFYILTIVALFILLVFSETIYHYFQPRLLSWEHKNRWFFYIKMAEILIFIFFNTTLLYINYQNNLFQSKLFSNLNSLMQKNEIIGRQKKEILRKNHQLKTYREELQTHHEELIEQANELNNHQIELNKVFKQVQDNYNLLVRWEKLATLGQLTSGIVYIIDKPIQSIKNHLEDIEKNIQYVYSVFKLYQEILPDDYCLKMEKINRLKYDLEFDQVVNKLLAVPITVTEKLNDAINVIKELKSFSRVALPQMVKSDLISGLNSTLTLLGHLLKPEIQLIKEFNQVPLVECFPGKINQVFMNLLSNAIQAVNEDLKVDNKYIKIVTSTLFKTDKEFVCIKIENNGPMISEINRTKVFEPFFTTKDKAGLGLSIAYNLIKEHKGYILIESSTKCTYFEIYLPINQN